MESTLRVVVVVIGLGLWYATQSLLGARVPTAGGGAAGEFLARNDELFAFTEPINRFLQTNPRWADGLLVVSSAVIDAVGLYLLLASVFGPTTRPFLGILILFALRQAMQTLCALPAPEGMIWRYPGVPSLLVTYHVASDFFFSGHTSIAVLGATEMLRLRQPSLRFLGVAVALFEAATVIVLRAHYTMDVFAGVMTALWAAHMSNRLSPNVDRFIARGCGVASH